MHDTRLLLALCQLLGNPDEFKDVQLYTMVNTVLMSLCIWPFKSLALHCVVQQCLGLKV